jgi:hypothetical protein
MKKSLNPRGFSTKSQNHGSRYDLIGAEELVSYDDGSGGSMDPWAQVDSILSGYDLIGARAPGIRQRHLPVHPSHPHHPSHGAFRAALQQAAAAKQAGAGVIVREQAPTKARRLVLPMSSTGTVAAGAAIAITARPQTIAYKPQRIVIPSTIAPDFDILDIKVGNKSQLVQSGSLPGEAFQPTLFDGEMDMDTCQTSQDFVLQVQNVGVVPRNFKAAVYGRSVDQ